MSSYKVSEPSALKFLKANGAVVDENGNVVSDASDYWKKVYDQAEPKVAKYLHADGTIDENPGSGGGADLEDNKEVTIDVSTYTEPVEIQPTSGKDGMKKATVTLSNIPSGGEQLRYFDGRNTGYADNPKGFWVIGKNQTSGKACCLVINVGSGMITRCVQTIWNLTSDYLSIDENGREYFLEVSPDVVAQTIANLS